MLSNEGQYYKSELKTEFPLLSGNNHRQLYKNFSTTNVSLVDAQLRMTFPNKAAFFFTIETHRTWKSE